MQRSLPLSFNTSDHVAHDFNALLLLATGFVVAAEGLPDDSWPFLFLAMLAAPIASSVRLWQRAKEDAGTRTLSPHTDPQDEMDPEHVLDLDARLEALERRERELDEAERIRQGVARGEQSAPAALGSAGLAASPHESEPNRTLREIRP